MQHIALTNKSAHLPTSHAAVTVGLPTNSHSTGALGLWDRSLRPHHQPKGPNAAATTAAITKANALVQAGASSALQLSSAQHTTNNTCQLAAQQRHTAAVSALHDSDVDTAATAHHTAAPRTCCIMHHGQTLLAIARHTMATAAGHQTRGAQTHRHTANITASIH